MTNKAIISGFLAASMVLVACSSETADDEVRGSGITGHSEAIIKSEAEVLESLETLWADAGAEPELAKCYADFFETEGLAEEVQDLDDLARVQSEFTQAQADEFASCGPNTN